MSRLARRKDAGYLAFVRQHASVLTWDWSGPDAPTPYPERAHLGTLDDFEPVVAHHVRMGQGGGMGLKPTDYRALPLTDAQHKRLHHDGEAYYWTGMGVDPWAAMAVLLSRFLVGVSLPTDTWSWRGVFEDLEGLALERNG